MKIKKSDLKLGDIVICRHSYFKYILMNTIRGKRFVGNTGWMDYISSYNEDLYNSNSHLEFDIVSVYRPTSGILISTFNKSLLSLDKPFNFNRAIEKSHNITNEILKNFINLDTYV